MTEGKAKVIASGWYMEFNTTLVVSHRKNHSSIFPNHPFRRVCVLILIIFFKSSWRKISSAACNRNNSVPPTSSGDLLCGSSTMYVIKSLTRKVISSWVVLPPAVKCSAPLVMPAAKMVPETTCLSST